MNGWTNNLRMQWMNKWLQMMNKQITEEKDEYMNYGRK